MDYRQNCEDHIFDRCDRRDRFRYGPTAWAQGTGFSSGETHRNLSTHQEDSGVLETYLADLSNLEEVTLMCQEIKSVKRLDSVINNAGVLKTSQTRTTSNRDIRFEVNTVAPYLITRELLPIINSDGIVINLSSAAQRPVDMRALREFKEMSMEAYTGVSLRLPHGPLQWGENLRVVPLL